MNINDSDNLKRNNSNESNMKKENKPKKLFIIRSTNTIIEPIAMMIKIFNAFITISTMFTAFIYIHITYFAIILKILFL